jgi:hypothetical protein
LTILILQVSLVVPDRGGDRDETQSEDLAMELLTDPHSEYFVFATLPRMHGGFPEECFEWILSETVGGRLSCDFGRMFAIYGMIDDEPPLMRAGPDVYETSGAFLPGDRSSRGARTWS